MLSDQIFLEKNFLPITHNNSSYFNNIIVESRKQTKNENQIFKISSKEHTKEHQGEFSPLIKLISNYI